VADYTALVNDIVGLINAFELTPVPETVVDPGQRDPGRAPTQDEDPLNAVLRRISIRRDGSDGPLSGRRIGIKDSIAVAGVPTTAASRALEGNIAEADAVVVERLLAASAEIVATLNMEGFAWFEGANTGDFGPIRNPVDSARSAGGSSGGSAAALSYDWIDITLGTDQAGSNRIPASWCGVLGLKPTHGLVPYTGILRGDPTIDHVGR
jgi:amidase